MISLIPEAVDFQISTTDMLVKYEERSGAHVAIDVLRLEDCIQRKYTSIGILFNTVAELRCSSLNFYEAFHGGYNVLNVNKGGSDLDFWKENGYHPNSGFYQVDESEWLRESVARYDPQSRFELKHFLIIGNDSYVELLATGYLVDQ